MSSTSGAGGYEWDAISHDLWVCSSVFFIHEFRYDRDL